MRPAKFDAIRVAEISVNFLETPAAVTAKAAFVNTKSGATHGWTTGKRWSDETMAKLVELRELMERDLSAVHFEDGAFPGSPTTSSGSLREGFQGLGEHLGTLEEEVPQG
jgi:hypothetical protein